MYGCTFQLGKFTCWGSEGVKIENEHKWSPAGYNHFYPSACSTSAAFKHSPEIQILQTHAEPSSRWWIPTFQRAQQLQQSYAGEHFFFNLVPLKPWKTAERKMPLWKSLCTLYLRACQVSYRRRFRSLLLSPCNAFGGRIMLSVSWSYTNVPGVILSRLAAEKPSRCIHPVMCQLVVSAAFIQPAVSTTLIKLCVNRWSAPHSFNRQSAPHSSSYASTGGQHHSHSTGSQHRTHLAVSCRQSVTQEEPVTSSSLRQSSVQSTQEALWTNTIFLWSFHPQLTPQPATHTLLNQLTTHTDMRYHHLHTPQPANHTHTWYHHLHTPQPANHTQTCSITISRLLPFLGPLRWRPDPSSDRLRTSWTVRGRSSPWGRSWTSSRRTLGSSQGPVPTKRKERSTDTSGNTDKWGTHNSTETGSLTQNEVHSACAKSINKGVKQMVYIMYKWYILCTCMWTSTLSLLSGE